LKKNPDCAVCGESPTVTALIDYEDFCGMKEVDMSNDVRVLNPTELKARLDRGENIGLIDVREPYEWDMCNLGSYGAKLLPLGEIAERAEEIERSRDVVVYCRSGKRSESAIRHLQSQGFTNLFNLSGGINGWATEVDPDMDTY
jgi:adenylyltransferase/sulfurtransferase